MFKFKDRLPHLLMPSVIYQYHADSVRLAMLVKQLSSLKCAYHNIKDAPIEQEII